MVNAPVLGVPDPIGPGALKVAPFNDEAFRLGTLVADATTNGGFPVGSVEVNCAGVEIPPVRLVAGGELESPANPVSSN